VRELSLGEVQEQRQVTLQVSGDLEVLVDVLVTLRAGPRAISGCASRNGT
jgi:hypothetical protein